MGHDAGLAIGLWSYGSRIIGSYLNLPCVLTPPSLPSFSLLLLPSIPFLPLWLAQVLFKNLGVDMKEVQPTQLLVGRQREIEGNPDFSNKDLLAHLAATGAPPSSSASTSPSPVTAAGGGTSFSVAAAAAGIAGVSISGSMSASASPQPKVVGERGTEPLRCTG